MSKCKTCCSKWPRSSLLVGVSGQNCALYQNLNTAKWNWTSSGYAASTVLGWYCSVSGWAHGAVVLNSGGPFLNINGLFRRTGLKVALANVVLTFVIGSPGYGNYLLGFDENKTIAERMLLLISPPSQSKMLARTEMVRRGFALVDNGANNTLNKFQVYQPSLRLVCAPGRNRIHI